MADTGGLQLRYVLDECVDAHPLVERWSITATRGGVDVGDARVLILNLPVGMDVGDLVDRASGTWVDVPADAAGPPESHVLVLDRVWVHPEHRGHGLGPAIGIAIIERLRRGCHLAACYPAPFEGVVQDDEEHQRSVDALGAIWSKVGFRHWRDGVWMLELDLSQDQREKRSGAE